MGHSMHDGTKHGMHGYVSMIAWKKGPYVAGSLRSSTLCIINYFNLCIASSLRLNNWSLQPICASLPINLEVCREQSVNSAAMGTASPGF